MVVCSVQHMKHVLVCALDLPEKIALLGLLNVEAELNIVHKTVSALLATCKGKGKGIINFTLDGRIYVK